MRNDVLSIRELQTRRRGERNHGTEALYRSGVTLLALAQQFFGLFLKVFEVWLFG
ncbi:hypothetical protein SBA6_1010014 [Candidatus Sulfopaludibacter sp. SbA6]|nr:hypothetical protein SBA6_1010014 [Candidatus Sulfopaludibacter sp. SbA6]